MRRVKRQNVKNVERRKLQEVNCDFEANPPPNRSMLGRKAVGISNRVMTVARQEGTHEPTDRKSS
jgi:hypothetical protein